MKPKGAAALPLLEAVDIVKDFPGVRALDAVRLDVLPGEVHALVGENGAGKSTLMHVLAGALQPDAGEILLGGRSVRLSDTRTAVDEGIAVVYQELSLADELAICENVFANRQPTGALGLVDRAALRRKTASMLGLFAWDIDPETPVRLLKPADRQVVEILKALSSEPRIVILDEPTSSLASTEKERLFDVIGRMRAGGTTFIYISHHLSEVFALADRITVLRDGRRVTTVRAAETSERDIVRAMVGRELSDLYAGEPARPGDVRLEVRGASRGDAYQDVTFSVRSGEIVGLAGLAGAGRTELARGIFGAEPMDAGSVAVDGRALDAASPSRSIAAGLAYVTEARKVDGLFLDMSIRENCAAVRLSDFSGPGGLLDDDAIARHGDEMRRRFGIAAPDAGTSVGSLSGGNQQKVLFAMWAAGRPRALIADEPTRGVDVAARGDLYAVLRRLASEGTAILLISSDLPELLGMSDRILVMREGRIAGEFAGGDATEERIVACAAGVTDQGEDS